ncbi:MAG: hypothetical protein P4L22_07805 [Candidatus Babeliales bacterium]|nr:hypothetical protein [Candidatus Babeliales bacterium]
MIDSTKQNIKEGSLALGKQRSYNEIIELLDANWSIDSDKKLERIKKLDMALNQPSKNVNTIFVAGSNGKSLTINFISQLLKEDGFKVGSFYSPHILTYNERISLDNETIPNKTFAELANDVINAAESINIKASSSEILTMIALSYFAKNKVDVAVLEVNENAQWDPVNICKPKVLAITRVTTDNEDTNPQEVIDQIKQVTDLTQQDTWVISADQSKNNLQILEDCAVSRGGNWAMPIRKLVTLPYPFEQLHGRCAALAERATQIYVEKFEVDGSTIISNSLLVRPKGQRGRPTLEAKRESEVNPKKTLEQFWKDVVTTLHGRFQLLDKEKPSVLVDSATNIDAIENILLGIRLLHYQRPLKGLTIILGCEDNSILTPRFTKIIRYFFKKTSGQIIFCPVQKNPYATSKEVFNVEKITNEAKNAKIKAKSAKNFADAFDTAKQTVDERHGLIVIFGSPSVVTEYWNYKGIKKL